MFHYSHLGSFGSNLPRDINGYVPEKGDDWRDMRFDLGSDLSPDAAKNKRDRKERETFLDDEWWPEFVADAVRRTEEASAALDEWRERG